MTNNILITSTNSIEGAEIQRYYEILTTNVVIGTNVFSDFKASLSDFFGGSSGTYQKKLQRIYNTGLEDLKSKAEGIGANGIIGLNIDFDEISGQGKTMFMISLMGTPVKVKYKETTQEDNLTNSGVVSLDLLQKELEKKLIVSKITKNYYPNEQEWEVILSNTIEDILKPLLHCYLETMKMIDSELTEPHNLMKKNFIPFIKNIRNDYVTDVLFEEFEIDTSEKIELLKKASLFSAEKIIELLKKGQRQTPIRCLVADKKMYTNDDLKGLNSILEIIKSFEDTGKIEMVKQTFGKDKQKFICSEGHSNDLEKEFCTCGINIKGLNRSDLKIIDEFENKVLVLESLLNK